MDLKLNDIFTKVSISQEDFSKHVDKTFEDMNRILKEKNRMYGGASMDLGQVGVVVHLHDKMNRYKKLINNKYAGEDSSFEGVEDTLRDIIGYATIGLAILEAQEEYDQRGMPIKFPLGNEDLDEREKGRPASHGYVDQDSE